MNDQVAVCLMFGIYDRNSVGMIDRHECSVCHGDRCAYQVEDGRHGACPHCFGTGMAPYGVFDLENRSEAICTHCQGTGRI